MGGEGFRRTERAVIKVSKEEKAGKRERRKSNAVTEITSLINIEWKE